MNTVRKLEPGTFSPRCAKPESIHIQSPGPICSEPPSYSSEHAPSPHASVRLAAGGTISHRPTSVRSRPTMTQHVLSGDPP